jgi:hypothetical protein
MADAQEPMPVIDVLDPLVPAYTKQFFLRERFLHALEEVVAILHATPDDNERSPDAKLDDIRQLVLEALNTESIGRFIADGYPCPWMPEDPEAIRLTDLVVKSLRAQGLTV